MRIAVGLGKKGGEERLAQQGVSRRDFLKFCTAVAVTMGLGPSMATEVAAALTNRRASVVYLHCAECTGCSEALLRTCKPFLDTLILDTISLDYHETIMAAAGEAAEAALDQAISNPEGFICVVEGAIPTAMDGKYGYVGGHTMLDLCKRVLPKAKAVVTMCTCAAYGGVQAAKPNPTGSVGVNDCFARLGMDVKAINIPGCPPNPLNLVGTLVAFLQNKEIKLDDLGRPLMFYGQSCASAASISRRASSRPPSIPRKRARAGVCTIWAARAPVPTTTAPRPCSTRPTGPCGPDIPASVAASPISGMTCRLFTRTRELPA